MMQHEAIAKIEINEDGRLCIWPNETRFDLIYRTATEVHWDRNDKFLYSPKPREWSYLDWFKHIVGIVEENYDLALRTTASTDWSNIEPELKASIESFLQQN